MFISSQKLRESPRRNPGVRRHINKHTTRNVRAVDVFHDESGGTTPYSKRRLGEKNAHTRSARLARTALK